MKYSSLLDVFESFNKRKDDNDCLLNISDCHQWQMISSQVEQIQNQQDLDIDFQSRKSLRVAVSLSVRYRTKGDFKKCYIPDIGEGGLFISTQEPLAIGSLVKMEIEIAKNGQSLPLAGEVVWTRNLGDIARDGMGIKFVEMDDGQKSALYQLVDDCLQIALLERRQHSRLDLRIPIHLLYPQGVVKLTVEDICSQGIFVGTDHLVMKGESVDVRLLFPYSKEQLRLPARVVRAQETPMEFLSAGIGFVFENIDHKEKNVLLKYLLDRVDGTVGPISYNRRNRKYPRVKRRLIVHCQAADKSYTTFCRDLSLNGIFLESYKPFKINARVEMKVEPIEGRETVMLSGRVVRVVAPRPTILYKTAGMGVVFDEFEEEKSKALRELLRSLVLYG
jgi:uncharacterized protein (TIGR02266 family)